MRRATIAKYIRLSVEDEKYDSLSIENQRAILDAHIDSLGIPDSEVLEFVDNGHTGTNFERPAVQEMLEMVRQNKIDCILVKDFSRFGRNAIETGYFIEMVFPLFCTRFISVDDSFDSDDHKGDTGGLEISFKFLMHEYYSQDMSRKEKSAKYIKFERGEYQSILCPYGYRKSADGRMEPDEVAAPVVRRIFEMALEGINAPAISKELFAEGIPTPGEYKKANGRPHYDTSRTGGVWPGSTILRILYDERYTGVYIMGKRAVTEIGSQRVRLKDESEWFKIPNHHPAIIGRELFEQVQAKLRRFKCPKTSRDYVLRSKVFCGCCRHAMQWIPRKAPAFVCRSSKINPAAECHGLEIGELELETLLYEIISTQARVILGEDEMDTDIKHNLLPRELAENEVRLAALHADKRNFYERMVLGEIDVETYQLGRNEIDATLIQYQRSRDATKARISQIGTANEETDMARAASTKANEAGKLTRPLAEMLIDKVWIFPDNRIEVEWKLSGFAGYMMQNEVEETKNVN